MIGCPGWETQEYMEGERRTPQKKDGILKQETQKGVAEKTESKLDGSPSFLHVSNDVSFSLSNKYLKRWCQVNT